MKDDIFKLGKKGIPLVILGLEKAGKTSFVQRLLTGKFTKTTPTMGLSLEKAKIGDINFDIFDLGGHEAYRKTLWETYVKLAYGIIFIVDAYDRQRLPEAKKEFWRCVSIKENDDEFLILFLCNKVDLEGSATLEEIINELELNKLAEKPNCSYQFFKVSVKTGENINYAISWLSNQALKLAKKKKITPLLLLLMDHNGYPILELDNLGLKQEPSLLSGFISALETFSSAVFGKQNVLNYMVAGEYKYIIKSSAEYICTLIISSNEEQEEARRLMELILAEAEKAKDYTHLEEKIFEILSIKPQEYDIKRGYCNTQK